MALESTITLRVRVSVGVSVRCKTLDHDVKKSTDACCDYVRVAILSHNISE